MQRFLYLLLLAFLFSCGALDSSSDTSSSEEKAVLNEPSKPIISTPTGSNSNSKENTTTSQDKNAKETFRIMSWNLYNFGKSKDAKEIEYIAGLLKDFDIVAVQEVSTSLYGIRACGKLADELNRTGSKWEYKISEPTEGDGTERYAYFWKTNKTTLKTSWLEENLQKKVDREPFMARFELKKTKQTMLIASFHAIPTSKKPETEIVLLDEIPNRYRGDNILIMGDFNLSEKHKAFGGLKERSLVPALRNQKTSLRMKEINGSPLNEEYDNIFVESRAFTIKKSGFIPFYDDFKSLKAARYISDHVPVWVELSL